MRVSANSAFANVNAFSEAVICFAMSFHSQGSVFVCVCGNEQVVHTIRRCSVSKSNKGLPKKEVFETLTQGKKVSDIDTMLYTLLLDHQLLS